MPSVTFCRLVDELCRQAALPNPQALYERTALTIDGVHFSLVERAAEPYAEVLIYLDLGPLPEAQRAAVLLRLLEINFHLFVGAGSPSCAYNSESQRLLLCLSLLQQGASGAGLLQLLGQLAELARNWRKEHFLDGAAVAPGGVK